MNTIKGCKICGFPIEYRPNLFCENGVCGACINAKAKQNIDFKARQEWLSAHLEQSRQLAGGGGI
ncbi:hypothetical protein [Helicobacter marmotae]|uniref:hypothetical protein n=1 Tax=Helicobacter marmotae TaxID=152490 RepID=UPI000CF0DB6D|nr:hypothetical protein [Helicobacter marmotae]